MTHQTVIARFQEMAGRYPERPAMVLRGLALTYRELDEGSAILGGFMTRANADDPGAVGIVLRREDQLLAGCLAALKANRPFVCLSPDDTRERRRELLRRTGARLVLRNHAQGPIIPARQGPAGNPLPRMKVDLFDAPAQPAGQQSPPAREPGDSPVFIVHTSGSTGSSLSVERNNRNTLHNIDHLTRLCRITPDDRISMLIPPTFGACFNDVFLALLNGACLFPFDVKSRGYRNLLGWFQKNQVTFCHCVPTLFRSFCHVLPAKKILSSVRILRVGGEPLHRSDVELMKRHFSPDCVMINSFSMTESAGSVADLVIRHDTVINQPTVPIGYPADDREIFLLDESGDPVPQGKTGEIVVRSRFLCSAYLSHPEMTARRFRRCSEDPDCILLHTGDLGRFDEDGCLHHLGRKDGRMKLRGKRVDLGELEAIFAEHDGIEKFAAILIDQEGGLGGASQKLIGFVVPRPGRKLNGNVLFHWAENRLPKSPVPSEYRLVADFPLLPNGKIDRRSLSAETGQESILSLSVGPRNETEESIAGIWKRHLKRDDFGVYDAFFEMGGDSLSAMAVGAEISQVFGVEVQAYSFAGNPSVAALAELVISLQRESPDQKRRIFPVSEGAEPMIPLRPGGGGEPILILPGGAGGELELTALARIVPYLDDVHPVFGFRATCLGNLKPAPGSVEEIAAFYVDAIPPSLRSRGMVILGNCLAGMIAFEMARCLLEKGLSHRLILNDCRTPGHRSRFGRFGNFEGWDETAPPQTALQSYFKIVADFRPGPYPGDLILIVSDEYARTPVESLGWGEFVTGEISIRRIGGTHLDSIRGAGEFGEQLAEAVATEKRSPLGGR